MARSDYVPVGTIVNILKEVGSFSPGDRGIIGTPYPDEDEEYKIFPMRPIDSRDFSYIKFHQFEVLPEEETRPDGSECLITHASLPVLQGKLEIGDVILSPKLHLGIVLSHNEDDDIYTIINTGVNAKESRGAVGKASGEYVHDKDHRRFQNVFDIYESLPFARRERLNKR